MIVVFVDHLAVAVFRGVNVCTRGHAREEGTSHVELRHTLGLSEQFERDRS